MNKLVDNIKEIRELMVDDEIENWDTGWFEYKGKMHEVLIIRRTEEIEQ